LGGIAARRRLAAAETIDTDRWRDPNETLRTATPLKLLHDLAFVVAFAAAAEQLGMERSGGSLQPADAGKFWLQALPRWLAAEAVGEKCRDRCLCPG
jgi:low temperature requirement protein LtrA